MNNLRFLFYFVFVNIVFLFCIQITYAKDTLQNGLDGYVGQIDHWTLRGDNAPYDQLGQKIIKGIKPNQPELPIFYEGC